MELQKKSMKIGAVFLALIIVAGVLLMYTGNDAVAMGMKKKDGILTAEQVKVSFDSVNGRLVKEAVKEADEVKKGDVLMVLDSTDVDLSLEKTVAQIGQLEAQIQSAQGTMGIGFAQTDTTEEESRRGIDQQRAAADAAEATLANSRLDYERKQSLVEQGAISRSEMDNAQMALNVATANVAQQKQALAKLLGGAADTGDTDSLSLPSIEQSRATVANKQNDIDALIQQKKQLDVTLKELQVQKKRLTLRAPEDGKVLKILSKEGEMVSANTPVILLESKRYYYDIYVSEIQAARLSEGSTITGTAIAGGRKVAGTVRLITQAPGFADLKMSREKGQADLSAFQIRIYTDPGQGAIPGMTIEVKDNEFNQR